MWWTYYKLIFFLGNDLIVIYCKVSPGKIRACRAAISIGAKSVQRFRFTIVSPDNVMDKAELRKLMLDTLSQRSHGASSSRIDMHAAKQEVLLIVIVTCISTLDWLSQYTTRSRARWSGREGSRGSEGEGEEEERRGRENGCLCMLVEQFGWGREIDTGKLC